jgi:hypothetical protein
VEGHGADERPGQPQEPGLGQKDEESQRLKAKIGELSMENELLYEKIRRM